MRIDKRGGGGCVLMCCTSRIDVARVSRLNAYKHNASSSNLCPAASNVNLYPDYPGMGEICARPPLPPPILSPLGMSVIRLTFWRFFSVTKAEVETDFVNGNLLVICHSRADHPIASRTVPKNRLHHQRPPT